MAYFIIHNTGTRNVALCFLRFT